MPFRPRTLNWLTERGGPNRPDSIDRLHWLHWLDWFNWLDFLSRPSRSIRLAALLGGSLVFFGIGCASTPSPQGHPEKTVDPSDLALSTESSGWSDSEGSRYALVIDASSSASTLQIFEWRPAVSGQLPRVEAAPRASNGGALEAWGMRVKPGLGSYAGRPNEAAKSLEPLVRYALERIGDDPEELAKTSVFVRATAGMRLLDDTQQAEIIESIDAYLQSLPFGAISTRVISGAEEGLYGWITANYILGHLEHGGRFPTVGVLDLGGASTQITFQPLDFPRRLSRTLTLGSNTYTLYTKSYLGLGQDVARERVASPACFLVGYPTPHGPGTGEFDACRLAIREKLALACSEDDQPCTLFGSYQPPLYGDFLAISAYAYIADFFGLREQMRPKDLEDAGREFCRRDWQRWVALEPGLAEDPYVPTYCYAAAHVVTLLTEGLGFPADTDRIRAPLKIQGLGVNWTLGALLFELAGSAAD